jgi:hypothetical protein
MAQAWQYWTQVWVDGTLTLRTTSLEAVQGFWLNRFPQYSATHEVPADIPRHLAQQCHSERDAKLADLAATCLRCFVSQQLKAICLSLAQRYGLNHGFTADDLFPLVLYQDREQANEQPGLITKILDTWDAGKSTLASWVSALFRSDREVRRFLFEHGIEQISNWLILCRTSPTRLQRYLTAIGATPAEQSYTRDLLEQFHQIYRTDHLATGQKRYVEPTDEQLQRISQGLSTRQSQVPDQVLRDLQALAKELRRDRTATVTKTAAPFPDTELASPEPDEQTAFLAEYTQSLERCLAMGMRQGVGDRLQSYQVGKSTPKARQKAQHKGNQFLQALTLFYCQGYSMGDIAEALALGHQTTVSRLLVFKTLHADMARHTVACLMDCVPPLAERLGSPDQVQQLSPQRFLTLLNAEVAQVIAEGAAVNRLNSLFARTLCHSLEGWKPS